MHDPIEPTRRTASSSASRPRSDSMRRACSRNRAATVWRLFFTRWWISRMVASLVINSRSRRRSSVTSLRSTSEPMRVPLGLSGMARNWITPSCASISNSRGAQPLATLARASSTGPRDGASSAVVRPR
ncbi:hypothetical protein STENM327S_03155 [Streptomyces tendae]